MKRIRALLALLAAACLFASCGHRTAPDGGAAGNSKAAGNADASSLCIYQVMVSTFRDGDPSIGYTTAWGPEEETGGDLQGIIDSLD